jgi:hypothetical protein
MTGEMPRRVVGQLLAGIKSNEKSYIVLTDT